MKKRILLFVLSVCVSAISYAGSISESKVPAQVKDFIKNNFPHAERISWDYEDDDHYYEAEFEIDGLEYELEISFEGKLLYCEQKILIESIPAVIKNYLNTNYNGYEILGAKKITKGQSVKYNVGIAGENSRGQKRHRNITFNQDGKVIKR